MAVLPYLNSLSADFTFDDVELIKNNPDVTGEQASTFRVIANQQYGAGTGLYRPIVLLTYFANARVSNTPLGYHAVNVLLHVLVTLLVFRVAESFLVSAYGAAAAALLFAAHPIHTEAVTSVVGRAELLGALCALAAIAASVHADTTGGAKASRWTVGSLVALGIGLFCKESVCAAIVLCVAARLWAIRPRGAAPIAAVVLPYALLGGAYLGFRGLYFHAATSVPPGIVDNPLAHVPLPSRLETALVILWDYLALLLVPLRLSADYSFPQIPVVASVLDPRFLAAAAGFAAMAAMLMITLRRAPALIWAAAFFLIPLGITANLLFPIGTIKAERLLYLPSFGWCLACGWLLLRAPVRPRVAQALLLAVVAAYAGRTWVRNQDWQDNMTLFRATVATSPRSAKAHHNLGVCYELAGQLDAAMVEYRRALALYPPYGEAALGIGNVYREKQLHDGALHWYAEAIAVNPSLTAAYLNIGIIHNALGEYNAAEAAFRTGLEVEPDNPRLLAGLGMSLIAQDREQEAAAVIARVIPLVANDPSAQELLAVAQEQKNQKDRQMRCTRRRIELFAEIT